MPDRLFSLIRLQVLERPVMREITRGESKAEVYWKTANAADIEALTDEGIQYNDGRKRFALEMLSEGSVCVIGYIEGEPAHIGWMSFDRVYSPPFSIPIGPGWVTFHRTRTAPAFRGLGLQGAGIRKRLELARERGLVRAVNMILTTNAVSLHNYHALGFEDVEMVWAARALGKWIKHSVPQSVKERLGRPAEEIDRKVA